MEHGQHRTCMGEITPQTPGHRGKWHLATAGPTRREFGPGFLCLRGLGIRNNGEVRGLLMLKGKQHARHY